jgi:hypothetical protein
MNHLPQIHISTVLHLTTFTLVLLTLIPYKLLHQLPQTVTITAAPPTCQLHNLPRSLPALAGLCFNYKVQQSYQFILV